MEYRRLQEDWAKQAFLAAQQRLIEGESTLTIIRNRRQSALRNRSNSLEDHLTAQEYLTRIDNEEREQDIANDVLSQELETAKKTWIELRKDARVLERLREKAESAWISGVLRQEQIELDEWTAMRRAA